MKCSTICLVALTAATPAGAQSGMYYPEPAASTFAVSRDVRYASVDTGALKMDIYRPAPSGTPRPALIFFTGGTMRANPGYAHWGRVAASKGLVAVVADLRLTAMGPDFRTLLGHLTERATDYGIDTAAIAVYGASSNALNSSAVVQDPTEKRVKASIMYYGGSDVARLRRDLPVLLIRAGIDRPFVNASIDSLIARALTQNAPITVINHSGGHHSFESTDDDIVTRELIDQTVDFVKRVTAQAYRAAVASRLGYATAAAHVYGGDFGAAATSYAELVERKPEDHRLRLSYGGALLADRQFAKACAEFAKLKGKGLGPRDLGLPAASACLQNGDPELAMAWLVSIPKRFLPARVKDDPVFTSLKDRADFKALFEP